MGLLKRRRAGLFLASVALLTSVVVPSRASATVTVTSHFIWTATSSNTTGFVTVLNNGATNGEPNALLFVTPNLSPGGVCTCVTDPKPVGVVYNLLNNGRWAIVHLDESTNIPIGASYNVLVVQKTSANVFVQTATTNNTSGADTFVNSTQSNGRPLAQLLVTPNLDPGGTHGFVSNHVVGVAYSNPLKKWAVFNEDVQSMSVGAHFNVMIGATVSNGGREILQRATSSNTAAWNTLVNNPESTGNPNAVLFETPSLDPGGVPPVNYDAAPTGVLYRLSPTDRTAVFHEDMSTNITIGAAYNVLIFPS